MYDYASAIRRIRKQKKIKQTELVDGICSQGMISKIEKQQLRPDIDLLVKIAEKLDVTVAELIGEAAEEQHKKSHRHINKFIDEGNFDLLEDYLATNTVNADSILSNPAYFEWVSAVVTYNKYKKADEALKQLQKSLKYIKQSDEAQYELKVRVYNAIGSIYSELGEFDKSLEALNNAIELFNRAHFDSETKQRVFFSFARVHSYSKHYIDTIFYTETAIQLAIDNNSLFALDSLYLLLADTYMEFDKLEQAQEAITKATLLADMKNNSTLKPFIERTQSQLDAKITK